MPANSSRHGGSPTVVLLAVLALLVLAAPGAEPAIRLTSPPYSAMDPAVAIGPDGLIRLVWVDDRTGGNEVQWAEFDGSGRRIEGPIQITSTGAAPSHPRIGVDDTGRTFIIWRQGGSLNGTIWFARVGTDGDLQVPPKAVETGTNCGNPDISVSPTGDSHVVYQRTTYIYYVYYRVLDAAGNLIRSEVPGNWGILPSTKSPAVSVDASGRTTVVWLDDYGFIFPSSYLYRAVYPAGGGAPSISMILNRTVRAPDVLSLSSLSTYIVAQDNPSGSDNIYRWVSNNHESAVSPPPGPSRAPRLAGEWGRPVLTVWVDSSTGTGRIYAGQWGADGTLSDNSIPVSDGVVPADDPDIATDGQGRFAVVWRGQPSGGQSGIYLGTLTDGVSPDPISPADGDTLAALPLFTWHTMPEALGYVVRVAKDPSLNEIVWTRQLGDTTASYPYDTPLDPDSTYWWSVRAASGSPFTSFATPRSFRLVSTAASLLAPALNTPGAEATVKLPETFSWLTVPGAVAYVVQARSGSPAGPRVWLQSTQDLSIRMPAATINTGSLGYWSVTAVDPAGQPGMESEVRQFSAAASVPAPGVPDLVFPGPDASVASNVIPFDWSDVPGATSYDLTYSVDPAFPPGSDLTWSQSDIIGSSKMVTLAPRDGEIYWRVSAVNSGGDGPSSSVGSFTYSPPAVPISMISLYGPESGVIVPEGTALFPEARITGTFTGTVTGDWWLDGASWRSFQEAMDVNGGLQAEGPLLPTSLGDHAVQLRISAPTPSVSGVVTYRVTAQVIGPPARLALLPDPASIPPDGASQSTLLVRVEDAAGHLVAGDTGRNIHFALSGGGSLSASDAATSGGVASVTLTAGTGPDQARITATASGLDSGSATVYVESDPVEIASDEAHYYSGELDDLRYTLFTGLGLPGHPYDVQSVQEFLASRIDTATPDPADLLALHRLNFALRGMRHAYNFDPARDGSDPHPVDAVPGALTMADDAGRNLGSIVDILVGSLFESHTILVPLLNSELLKSVVQPVLSRALVTLAQYIYERCAPGVASPDDALLQEAIDLAFGEIQSQFGDGGGSLFGSAAGAATHGIAGTVLLSGYASQTQGYLDQSASWAGADDFTGSEADADSQVTATVSHVRNLSGAYHERIQANESTADFLGTIADVTDALSLITTGWGTGLMALVGAITKAASAAGYFVNTQLGSRGLSAIAGTYVPEMAGEAFHPDGSMSPGRPSIVAAAGAPVVRTHRPSAGVYRTLLAEATTAQADYATLARQAMDDLRDQDTTSLALRLPGLVGADDQLADRRQWAGGPALAAYASALRSVPAYDSTYTALTRSVFEASFARIRFHLALAAYLADPGNAEGRLLALDQGQEALDLTAAAAARQDSIVTALFTTPAVPVVLLPSLRAPDSVSVGHAFRVTGVVRNVGAGSATGVYAAISTDSVLTAAGSDTVWIGSLASGDSASVRWTLLPTPFGFADRSLVRTTVLRATVYAQNGTGLGAVTFVQANRASNQTGIGAGAGVAQPFLRLTVSPNPIRSTSALVYDLGGRLWGTITVLDLQGRLVGRRTVLGPTGSVAFSELFQRPGRSAAGVYFVRLRAAGLTVTGKAVVVR